MVCVIGLLGSDFGIQFVVILENVYVIYVVNNYLSSVSILWISL